MPVETSELYEKTADLLSRHGELNPRGGERAPGDRVLETSASVFGVPFRVYIKAHEPPQNSSHITLNVPALTPEGPFYLGRSIEYSEITRQAPPLLNSVLYLEQVTPEELQQYSMLIDHLIKTLDSAPATQ